LPAGADGHRRHLHRRRLRRPVARSGPVARLRRRRLMRAKVRLRGREGFSLIEALEALAIASMTLMAIFELQIQTARGQQRAALAIEQVAAQENALALTRHLNPKAEPYGRSHLPRGHRCTW